MGGEGVRRRTTRSVSQPRCRLKGASGHVPRWMVVVALVCGGVGVIVSFCDGTSAIEDDGGRERVRDVTTSAKNGKICGNMLGER